MLNDNDSIEKSVRKHRALILFANKRTGSKSLIKWFYNGHKIYVDYDRLIEAVKSLGYIVNEEAERYNLFGKDGLFWDVTNQFLKDNNREKLDYAVKVILSYRASHRTLLEDIPLELVDSITKQTNEFHSSILLLTRRKSIERLTSLWYTQQAKLKEFEDVKTFDPEKFKPKRMDLDYLVDQEKYARYLNAETWKILHRYKPRFVHLSYEDFYRSSDVTILNLALKWLFYNIWDFQKLHETGHFNLNKYYMDQKNIDKLENMLKDIERPTFSNVHVDI